MEGALALPRISTKEFGLRREICDHIEMATGDSVDRGISPEEAHYETLRQFGSVTRVKKDTREV
jgi:hypothetical protein